MEYFTAKKYENWKRVGEPFTNEKGKLCTKVTDTCPRCSGHGIIAARVENGRIVPIPVDGGICYQCGGSGKISEVVRLYTQKEREALDRAAERRHEQAEQEREIRKEKMIAEAGEKAAQWRIKNGISEENSTYVITGDSYSIKDELKSAGWVYSPALKWHKASPEGYEDRVLKLDADFLQIEYSAWGDGYFPADLAKKVDAALNALLPPSHSEWLGEVGDKIKNHLVTLVRYNTCAGFRGGLQNIFTFEDEEGNVLTWFTSTNSDIEVNDKFYLEGTIKKLDEYKGTKQTVMTRCKLAEAR
ncbi:MAG: hypothetical protein J6T34_00255 [Bacilli bacterium]|nr:hypothetical protein [Bacilli bacterium]